MKIIRESPYIWRIKKYDNMKVDAIIFTDSKTINNSEYQEAINQLINVATLPGIVKAAYAMPDIHWGYGFPIGGVAAFDKDEGIISPGGVGFDINCGVRVMITPLNYKDIDIDIDKLIKEIYNEIPVGIGSRTKFKFSVKEMKNIIENGAYWAVSNNYGISEDLNNIEDSGKIIYADSKKISSEAIKRGSNELGTLGSGNHFIEIQKVEKIYDKEKAKEWGLFENQIVYTVHSGSRGLGHQVATDYIKIFRDNLKEWNKKIPDKQLINAPFNSQYGQDYFFAMNGAANFAFANRQVMGHQIRKIFKKIYNVNVKLLYDITHNIAKLEKHNINGKEMDLIVHRKGATRAYENQPVLIPGDMGTSSYILIGTAKSMKLAFGSSAHGAGRVLGRRQAKRRLNSSAVINELKEKNIHLIAKSKSTIVEEAPEVYKNIEDIVNIIEKIGISKKIAKLTPVGVVKG
ncbi:tRNA-splicing ligase RtcB [Marinitoga hydrogenitolerans DSM 16785]|uniref:tRNA-splicing ligase RtcB n=1 Tax=Marinitoga hydrogenitolerans (strain DSM 16785 / JCM 12826 / AT1271) TaxID=1122195 RepID=A0A1M4VS62_MARH1|nr:RtcB family protein [Marinitoga hydrogenitolerans]SHE71705.1 tRNA-splicing ligase RtcB [Marinitoga hydrogenitolerans DSM 16785]